MNHEAITNAITRNRTIPYGVGITPNPFESQQKEWVRRHLHAEQIKTITDKIVSLFEPRFITPPETSECIEAIVRMTEARKVLEIGTCTGFTTLHMLRALIGKEPSLLVTVDARPAHDANWFQQWFPLLQFVEGWTPAVLKTEAIVSHAPYDLVFVDSDHTVDHTRSEMEALLPLTKVGSVFLFHDVPEWQSPKVRQSPPVRSLLFEWVKAGRFQGGILPTCEQLDCLDTWGPGYPQQCNPHLGIFVRTQ